MSPCVAFDNPNISKIGLGSLGGKAQGLMSLESLVHSNPDLRKQFKTVELIVPPTIVLATDGFDTFIKENHLNRFSHQNASDETIAEQFLKGKLPSWIESALRDYLAKTSYPLAIRSSSLLEDARLHAYAGLYSTFMLSNDQPDFERRVGNAIQAIKLIYASTYYQAPKAFDRRVGHTRNEEKMAVIIQQAIGNRYGDCFYPAISGVAQSHNYYPYGRMKPEEGIATIAMGLGMTIARGERSLRFSPKHPHILPHRAGIEDTLENAQRYYYCLKMGKYISLSPSPNELFELSRREISDDEDALPVQLLSSTYVPEENRIRDTIMCHGYRVLTFAQVLKHGRFPLAAIISKTLRMGVKTLGYPVEIEFAVNLPSDPHDEPAQFAFLQIRPMSARIEQQEVKITTEEKTKAFCRSAHALGNAFNQEMHDIVFVRPDNFESSQTINIAIEIRRINSKLMQENRRYVLIGPGRWGSKDRFLGIPVSWQDISGVGAIVEANSDKIHAEPSQGSHFFHNISTLGINYITIGRNEEDYLDWQWLMSQPASKKSEKQVTHISSKTPLTLKVDGRNSHCVIYKS